MKEELMSAAFRTILDEATEMIFLKDVDLVYQAVSAPFLEMVGKPSAEEVVGHTGFTGTCAWADPKNHLVFVFLSNRIYPRPFDHKQLMRLNIRPRMQQVMYQALMK